MTNQILYKIMLVVIIATTPSVISSCSDSEDEPNSAHDFYINGIFYTPGYTTPQIYDLGDGDITDDFSLHATCCTADFENTVQMAFHCNFDATTLKKGDKFTPISAQLGSPNKYYDYNSGYIVVKDVRTKTIKINGATDVNYSYVLSFENLNLKFRGDVGNAYEIIGASPIFYGKLSFRR